jgi:hypothetical protein
VSPGSEECPLFGQLRVSVVRSKKLVAEAGDPEEGERPPLEAAAKQLLVKAENFMSTVLRVPHK